MKKPKQLKTAAADYVIPRDRGQADEFIFEIGNLQRTRQTLQIKLDETIALLKSEYEADAQKVNLVLSDLIRGLQHWCESNRTELLKGDSKTVRFGNGEISWRTRPPKVSVRDTLRAISWYAQKGLRRFLRIKEELDKELMLRDAEAAGKNPFVSIGSAGEDFIVKPHELELEEVA